MLEGSKMVETVSHAWELLGEGKFDELAAQYSDDMIMVIPGQNDVISGKSAFRTALDGIGDALPMGFEITAMRYCTGDDEITNIVEWKSEKVPQGSQSAILWKFDTDGLISEERWYVDTEQWKNAL
jgi:ketosteroid isomerase-like protein